MAWYANRQSEPSQKRLTCGFDSHPRYWIDCVGWALASPGLRKSPAQAVQVQLLPDALDCTARSAFGEAAGFSHRQEGFDSPTGC